jgi:membrane dipeptidase
LIDGCVQIWPDGDFAAIPKFGISGLLVTAFDPHVDFPAAMRELLWWHGLVAQHPEKLRLALRAGDIVAANQQGQAALILGSQGLDYINDWPWALEAAWRLGLRVAQLTYNARNYVGDGCLEDGDAGLSRFGRRVVGEIARLGLVLDLCHVGYRTSMEAIELAKGPVLFSHANPRAVVNSPRNITDDQIKACAATGGVIGISPWGPLSWRRPAAGRPTVDDYLACLEHVAGLVGPQHVGIGTDMSIGTYSAASHQNLIDRYPAVFEEYGQKVTPHAGSPLRYVAGFDSLDDFRSFGGALAQRGFSPDEVEGILGRNFLRVFEAVWG